MTAMLRLAVAVLLVLLVWQVIDGPAAAALLVDADPLLLLLALLLLSGQIVLSALRWSMTARALDHPLPWRTALAEYHLGMLLNLTLPGGVLGDAGRALRTRDDGGIALAAKTVIIERLSGQVMLALFLGAGLMMWPPALPWGPRIAGVGAVAAMAAIGLLVTGPSPLRRFGVALWRSWTPLPRSMAQGTVNLAILGCSIGAMAACSAAVGAPLGFSAMVVVPLTLVAMLLPFSIGGWGLREGAAVVVWPLAGHTAQAGLAASVAFGTLGLLACLPGIAINAGRRPPSPA